MQISVEGGVHLSVQVVGSGNVDVLFIHGWMTTGSVYAKVLDRLDANIRAVVPDQRGTGGSSRPKSGYSLQQLAADAWQVADEVGMKKPAIVGHSMGGQIAQLMAAMRPDDVGKLVLLCPVPAAGLPLPDDAMGLFSTAAGDAAKLATILDIACKTLAPADRDALVDSALQIDEAALVATLHSWTRGGIEDQLASITAETLVIGTDDPFLPPEFLQTAVVDLIKNARLQIIRGPGHYANVEAPDEIAAAINAFLCSNLVSEA
jgi:pimeloyl-ACP methyl ester carboxylesterase